MSQPFDAGRGVVVPGELFGPAGSVVLRLAVDTGATRTMINVGLLAFAGYDPSLAPSRVQVTTGSGGEYPPLMAVERIAALGQDRRYFPVLAHSLPSSASIDGLLGLDYMRDQRLVIDFRQNTVALG